MSADPSILIHKYFEGLLEGAEAEEFNARVRLQPDFRALLARMSYDEAAMRTLVDAAARPVAASVRLPIWKRVGPRIPVAAAAAVLLGIVVLVLTRSDRGPVATLASGKLIGADTSRLSAGQKVTVAGDKPAVIRFNGGGIAELDPGTEAIVRNASVELLRGDGRFTDGLRVHTTNAEAQGDGASYRAGWRQGNALFIAVTNGTVRADVRGKRLDIEARNARIVGRESGSVTLAEAIECASIRGGSAIALEATREGDRFAIEFAIGTKGLEVYVDVNTGRITGEKDEDENTLAVAAAVVIPLRQAIGVALRAVPGEAVEASMEHNRKGEIRIEVKVLSGSQVIEVHVDGRTGELVIEGD